MVLILVAVRGALAAFCVRGIAYKGRGEVLEVGGHAEPCVHLELSQSSSAATLHSYISMSFMAPTELLVSSSWTDSQQLHPQLSQSHLHSHIMSSPTSTLVGSLFAVTASLSERVGAAWRGNTDGFTALLNEWVKDDVEAVRRPSTPLVLETAVPTTANGGTRDTGAVKRPNSSRPRAWVSIS